MLKLPALESRTRNSLASHRQRAAASGVALNYGLDELRALVRDALRLPCRYCRREMTAHNWCCDHAMPTSRGGSFDLDNVEVICRTCNEAKGSLSMEEFSDLLACMRDWSSAARMNVLSRLRAGGVRMNGR